MTFERISSLLVVGLLVLSCTQAPKPAKEPVPALQAPNPSSTAEPIPVSEETQQNWVPPEFSSPTPAITATKTSGCSPQQIPSFDFRRLQICVDSLWQAGHAFEAASLLKMQIQPQNTPEEIGHRTLQLARILRNQGKNQEANALIEDFLVHKPVFMEWIDSAAALDSFMNQNRENQVHQASSLVKQISNLMAIRAEYGLVSQLTDSLRSMPIPDSLRHWSFIQDSLALEISWSRAESTQDSVREQALSQGNYTGVRTWIAHMRQAPTELQKKFSLDSLETWLEAQESADQAARDPHWWKGRDPIRVFQEARRLRDSDRVDSAIILYRHLQGSPLRKEARQDLEQIAEPYCNTKRQRAAVLYASARKSKKANESIPLLNQAIEALDQCLEQFPDVNQRKKILQNKNLLQKEKKRLTSKRD
ncbi:MAG TPA: hypothetical protein VLM37_01805 [Fibrobacteraceae bacterium]|nr:hypothetical protein [Fibrobacteraceae bacterium]